MKRPEILSPAGDMEKLRQAVRLGADAVYLSGESVGMRSACANFTEEELREAVTFAHSRGVKIYVTVNVLPRTAEYDALERFLRFLAEIGADAVIVADVGVLMLVKRCVPALAIHVSTQASAVSAQACTAWYGLGAKRVVLARELTLEEVRMIRENTPAELELEAFVHGSMCIAYSGRCLLSNWFTGRDANHGQCAQPCRWNYTITEEKRPDEHLPVVEDGGTFIMSSRDMCMIEHVPELVEAGVDSFKIEGRVKSAYYTAVITNAYRAVRDAYLAGQPYDPAWTREVASVSHRAYHTGFWFTPPHEHANTVTESGYIREKSYLATALTSSGADGRVLFVQRNKVFADRDAELLTPGRPGIPCRLTEMYAEDGTPITSAPHPQMRFTAHVSVPVREGDIVRE